MFKISITKSENTSTYHTVLVLRHVVWKTRITVWYFFLGIFWRYTHCEIFCSGKEWDITLLWESWWNIEAWTSTSCEFLLFDLSLSLSAAASYLSSFFLQKVVGLFFGGLNAASTLSVIVVVIYGANLTIAGSMTPGALTSFILYSLTGNLS